MRRLSTLCLLGALSALALFSRSQSQKEAPVPGQRSASATAPSTRATASGRVAVGGSRSPCSQAAVKRVRVYLLCVQ